jgi:hypothetical protein
MLSLILWATLGFYFPRTIKGYLTWSGRHHLSVVRSNTMFLLPTNLYWVGLFFVLTWRTSKCIGWHI